MTIKHIIKGITREGRIVPVPVREDYDYEDRFPFEGDEYDTQDDALDALRKYRDDIRMRGDLKYITIIPVVNL